MCLLVLLCHISDLFSALAQDQSSDVIYDDLLFKFLFWLGKLSILGDGDNLVVLSQGEDSLQGDIVNGASETEEQTPYLEDFLKVDK